MAQMTTQQLMQLALDRHRRGALADAEAIYRQILAREPGNADALHLLGMVAYQSGRGQEAVVMIRRAVALLPSAADFHSDLGAASHALGNLGDAETSYREAVRLDRRSAERQIDLGNLLQQMGRIDEAVACFGAAVDVRPDLPEAHYDLGNALRERGRAQDAMAAYRQAIQFRPSFAEAYANLGNVMHQQGQMEEAIAAFRRAVELRPDLAEAHYNLGNALQEKGLAADAVAAYRRAIGCRPDYAEACSNLGTALNQVGQWDEAIASCQRAIQLKGDFAEAWNNLSNALRKSDRYDEAIVAARKALELRPRFAEAHHNLGIALQETLSLEDAIHEYDQAIGLKPDFADAHWNRALTLLLRGDFAAGWEEYEWRFRIENHRPRAFEAPRWGGEDAAGRTILLHAEQGLGDVIQFARFIPLLAGRGMRVILECPADLKSLMQSVAGVQQVVCPGEVGPQYDLQLPLMSLPLVLGTRLDSIPRVIPYMKPEAQRVQEWSERLGNRSQSLRVGVAWAGNPTHKQDRRRSLPVAELGPLAQVQGVRFYSLQKGPAAAQVTSAPAGLHLTDLTAELRDLADTAAMIENLDLVISVDTAVAHLAGALGRPVWVLLAFVPDWRWLMRREDSPWYPTMRLLRQSRRGDWAGVIRGLVEQVSNLLSRQDP